MSNKKLNIATLNSNIKVFYLKIIILRVLFESGYIHFCMTQTDVIMFKACAMFAAYVNLSTHIYC